MAIPLLAVDWDAPPGVRAFMTTRVGGVSAPPFASFNLGDACGDAKAAVLENRRRLRRVLPEMPRWLRQVHGVKTVCADEIKASAPRADAAYTFRAGVVCAALTADCLAVLLAAANGECVAAVHAGWRGLAAGVLENAVGALRSRCKSPLIAYLAPAIGRRHYEVGAEVRDAFLRDDSGDDFAFTSIPAKRGDKSGKKKKYRADLKYIACRRLLRAKVARVFVGNHCAYQNGDLFYSARRDGGQTGRNAALIWREKNKAARL
jgi:YfiH family protein